jgi:ethanolamine ammonia-lyase small subunit
MLPSSPDPWFSLRQLTAARIALGRSGSSLPTAAHLEFQLAHALARDAVHTTLERDTMLTRLAPLGLGCIPARSAVRDRLEYLRRPDLGRRLDEASAAALDAATLNADAAFVVADGLSALAVHRHAVPLLEEVTGQLLRTGWTLAPVVLAEQARVALGDEIGERLGAGMVVVLIGERPGLSAPDSLGVYLSWAPRVGLTDAERNCISNVRPAGLAYADAARRLLYLMREARRRRLTGVRLKEEAGQGTLGPVRAGEGEGEPVP